MANKKEKEKQLQDKLQIILADLLKDDDNKYCVDCDSKGPRWASWTLGIFLCIRCAGIHRNLGVHLSRVKSVNLDSWTPQQVAMMKEIGNSRGRAIYEANLEDNFRRPQTDSSLEQFIRGKYEHKRYIAKEWIPPTPSVDSISEEIRKLEQNQNRKRVNYNSNTTSNSTISISRREIIDNPVSTKKDEVDEKQQTVVNNKVDLLGLENDIVSSNIDDTFGDFVFASEPPISTNQVITNSVCKPVTVSSAVDDLMGLNLGNSNTIASLSGFNMAPNISASSPALPNTAGKLDKSSILALYNNSNTSGSVMGQMTSQSMWPNATTSAYQNSNAMHPDFQSQANYVVNGNNWAVSGQINNTSAFGVQHNPFYTNSVYPGQSVMPTISQPTFPTSVSGGHSQPPNPMLW